MASEYDDAPDSEYETEWVRLAQLIPDEADSAEHLRRELLRAIVAGHIELCAEAWLSEPDTSPIRWTRGGRSKSWPGIFVPIDYRGRPGRYPPVDLHEEFFSVEDGYTIEDGDVNWQTGTIVAKRLLDLPLDSGGPKIVRRAATGIYLSVEDLLSRAPSLNQRLRELGKAVGTECGGPEKNAFREGGSTRVNWNPVEPILLAQIADGTLEAKLGQPIRERVRADLIRHIIKIADEKIPDRKPSSKTVGRYADRIIDKWQDTRSKTAAKIA